MLLSHSNWDTRVACASLLKHLVVGQSFSSCVPGAPSALSRFSVDACLARPDVSLGSGRGHEERGSAEPAVKKLRHHHEDGGEDDVVEDGRSVLRSSRQRALMIRKEREGKASGTEGSVKRIKQEPDERGVLSSSSSSLLTASTAIAGDWGWSRVGETLLSIAVGARWEGRHGAMIGLRALADGGQEGTAGAAAERAACIAIEVLARDRFNDFLSDRVVAPVREAAASMLGAAMKHMDESSLRQTLLHLVNMAQRPEWEVRHAGLLGLRYAASVKEGLMKDFAGQLVGPLTETLKDDDDDVIAVSAETLLPMIKEIARQNVDHACKILNLVWKLLLSLDDLSASIGCLLRLMSTLYCIPSVAQRLPLQENHRISLMLPLFRHGVISVRESVAETLSELLHHAQPPNWANSSLSDLMRYAFQNIAVEAEPSVLDATRRLWADILVHSPPAVVCGAAKPLMVQWYALMASDLDDCPNLGLMRVNGASAIAGLLRIWPKAQLPVELITLFKMMCSPCGRERLTGALCFAKCASGNAEVAPEVASAFCSKLEPVLLASWDSSMVFSEDLELASSWWKEYVAMFNWAKELVSNKSSEWSVEFRDSPTAEHVAFLPKFLVCVESFSDRYFRLIERIRKFLQVSQLRRIQLRCATAAAWVSVLKQPKADSILDPVYSAIVSAIEVETAEPLQRYWAETFVQLVLGTRSSSCVPSSLSRLVKMLTSDRKLTPEAGESVRKEQSLVDAEEEVDVGAAEASNEEIASRGAIMVFRNLGSAVGAELLSDVGVVKNLWQSIYEVLKSKVVDQQNLVDCLRVLHTLLSSVNNNPDCLEPLQRILAMLFESMYLCTCWESQCLIGDCVAVISSLFPVESLKFLCCHILPKVKNGKFYGIIALLCSIHRSLKLLLVRACAFLAFLVAPTLGAMSDRDLVTRRVAASAFAQIVSLMPLEAGVPDPPDFGEELSKKRVVERTFIQHLVGGKAPSLEDLQLGLVNDLKLRPYQEAGVSWLVFLARYKLHGILADDMGLGKTVQTLCAISAACSSSAGSKRVSLIVCPASVVHHWVNESKTLFRVFDPFPYVGSVKERSAISSTKLAKHNLIITSYEVLRKDTKKLQKIDFLYVVLDEGHIIRNPKSFTSISVKSIRADHRLILSGTPLQNNVVELWSLFDFLTPGYLGTETDFRRNFGKPILASRDPKAKALVRERGTLALESLHRQILPFIMRRTKESVLKDLPPKIIQDYLCELSPLQKALYDSFSTHSRGHGEENPKHVFQALQHLRKLCNHPSQVLEFASTEQSDVIQAWLKENKCTLDDAEHSGKLLALESLLKQCGIGGEDCKEEEACKGADAVSTATPAMSHRVLIFCQLSSSLDLIEKLLFKSRMKSVSYLRMDSSLQPAQRFEMVSRFNSDPTVDVMLLTVKVGGLGLNMTGADTVIFFEHDWNPQVDAQAMDRAHRLGQKRVVNVYRIITRDTLEESIMSLQHFKMRMAKAVVNEENASMSTMETGALLDLVDNSAKNQGLEENEPELDMDEEQLRQYAEMALK